MHIKLLLSGDGGQGIQLMSDMICKAAFDAGWHVSHIPNYGLEQRGGVSLAFIQIADKEIAYPRFTKPDVLVVLSEQARLRTKQYQGKEDIRYLILDISNFENQLKEKNINPRSYNIFFLGLLAKILEEKNIIKAEEILKLLEKKLSNKPGWEENRDAFELGKDIKGY